MKKIWRIYTYLKIYKFSQTLSILKNSNYKLFDHIFLKYYIIPQIIFTVLKKYIYKN